MTRIPIIATNIMFIVTKIMTKSWIVKSDVISFSSLILRLWLVSLRALRSSSIRSTFLSSWVNANEHLIFKFSIRTMTDSLLYPFSLTQIFRSKANIFKLISPLNAVGSIMLIWFWFKLIVFNSVLFINIMESRVWILLSLKSKCSNFEWDLRSSYFISVNFELEIVIILRFGKKFSIPWGKNFICLLFTINSSII